MSDHVAIIGMIAAFLWFLYFQRAAKRKKPSYEFSWALQILGTLAWPIMIPIFCCICIAVHYRNS